MHTHFFIFLFFTFYLHFWAGLDPASPDRSGSLAQASDPKKTDARVKQFHACINSAKVIKLPSHCSNVI